jgi:inhibitor of KinA
MSRPRLPDAGEAARVVERGTLVDPALSDRVLALDEALAADPPRGLRERVPTCRSLMLHDDPLVLDRARLAEHVLRLPCGRCRAVDERSLPIGSPKMAGPAR